MSGLERPNWRWRWALCLSLLALGCQDEGETIEPLADSDVTDVLAADADSPDSDLLDSDLTDAEPMDAAMTDAEAPDSEIQDAEAQDSEIQDAEAQDSEIQDAGVEEDGGPPHPLLPCNPPLSLRPDLASALPLSLLTFQPAGGTGQWRYSLRENASGAVLNPITGAYLAGEAPGVTDVIALTDLGCRGEITASVDVVNTMIVRPEGISVAPGDQFTFEVAEGSGTFDFELIFAGAGGAVDGLGVYSAPDAEGLDVIRVRDHETGQERDVEIQVTADATLQATPPELAIALGERQPITVSGGSGEFEIAGGEGLVQWVDGQLEAIGPGRARLTLTDRFTGRSAPLGITVVPGQQFEQGPVGDGLLTGPIVGGDFNGDGFADVAIGWPESDLGAFNGGAVFVFTGGPDGPQLAWQITGSGRNDELGWGLEIADVNGDDIPDLIAGAHQADVNQTDNGAVYIHHGLAGGLFEEAPSQILAGPFSGDRAGRSLAACDFNGDGSLDLAVGAFQAEDRSVNPRTYTQGSVMIYLGAAGGLPADPDQSVWGVLPSEEAPSGWAGSANLQLGRHMTAGDFDGDGRCDLAVSALSYRAPASTANNDGAVFLYRGLPPGPLSAGGVTALPVRAWAPTSEGDSGSQLGRRLAMGDVNGDGRADLLISHHLADGVIDGNDRINIGKAWLHLGADLTDEPALGFETPEAQAQWSHAGDAAYRQAGLHVSIGDVDGVPPADVIIGDYIYPVGGSGNTGRAALYLGVAGGVPGAAPDRVLEGVEGGERFAQAVAPVGDMDGDEAADLIVAAGRTDTHGYDVGEIYLASGEAPPQPLGLPSRAAGARFGRGVAVIGDVNQDGWPDVAVGASFGEHPDDPGINQGQVALYAGGPDGVAEAPFTTLYDHVNHSGSDLLGREVSPAGDFNGDGIDDLWVSAYREDKPNTFNNNYYEPISCPESRNDAGAMLLYPGGPEGPQQPSHIVYGLQRNDLLYAISGPLDVNGDGLDDVIFGFPEGDHGGLNNSGGFMVVFGRRPDPAAADRLEVICDPADHVLGGAADLQLGRSVTPLGDLDGDGCDDFAVGAYLSDHDGRNNQGAVYLFRGWGGGGCPGGPTAVGLESSEANAQAGWALAAGDVDGDGISELAVGAVNALIAEGRGGATWLISGSRLAALIAEAAPLVGGAPAAYHPFLDGESDGVKILGLTSGARQGSALSIRPSGDGRPGLLAIGSPFGAQGGVDDSGGVTIYALDPATLAPTPWLIFGGEPSRPEGRLGEALHGLSSGLLVVGGYQGQGGAEGVDLGAAYVIPLP